MIQAALDFTNRPRCVVPDAGTQNGAILRALQAGERLTSLMAFQRFGCVSFPKRICELRDMGWTIQSRKLKVPSGKTVKEFWIEIISTQHN